MGKAPFGCCQVVMVWGLREGCRKAVVAGFLIVQVPIDYDRNIIPVLRADNKEMGKR